MIESLLLPFQFDFMQRAFLIALAVAAPMALLLSALFTAWRGAPPVDMAKAQHLLADLDPLSWALPHAAIAGFYLFLSGLITGFFANQAAYDDIGARLAMRSRRPCVRYVRSKNCTGSEYSPASLPWATV